MSTEKTEHLDPEVLNPFEDNPFQSFDENEYNELRDSIKEFGIITPLIVNQSADGYYEIISGHRRWQVALELGLKEVPVFIKAFTKEEATIKFVDCNLSREKILPSEKAKAYKMKHDAMKKQGARSDLTSSQLVTKFRSDEMLAETMPDSRMQIQRYIRLNSLIKPLLDLVDEGKISFTPAVELSYLTEDEQQDLLQTIESEEATPSLSQAQRMHKLSEKEDLDIDTIFSIMQEKKGNQIEYIKIPVDTFKKYFRKDMSPKRMEEITQKALAYYANFLQKQRQWER